MGSAARGSAAPSKKDRTALATPEQQPPADQAPDEPTRRSLLRQLRPAIIVTLLLVVITGIAYPLAVMGAGQGLFHDQANGSIVTVNGKPVASKLIGQYWTQPQYFHGRPSATNNLQGTPAPYEADNSAGSNLGPTNAALITNTQQAIDELKKENPDVPAGTPIPADLVTTSASGLDPDISVAAAYYQIPRIAKARHLSQDAVRHLVDQHVQGRFLGIFGEPRLNVLELNMALDGISAQ